MSKIEVDAITEQSGTTLTTGGGAGKTVVVDATTVTLGRCGGTVALASGASQTGFGRTGTVDWQTGSIKTTTFTAANGEGYFVDTSSGAVTANLPAGSAGAIVAFSDYTRTFNNNNLTISPNGSEKIGGVAQDLILNVNGQALTLIYVDGTEGWINVQNAEDTETGIVPAYIAATGGTITTVCTNYKVHTFTGPGTFEITAGAGPLSKLDYLVIAGGGGGGGRAAAGGGAGGYRESKTAAVSGCWSASPLVAACSSLGPFTVGSIPVTVGGGGAGGTPPGERSGVRGSSSIFSTITSTGGGGGGSGQGVTCSPGGSGGGGAYNSVAGTGNTPPVSPPQGQNGSPTPGVNYNSGGGGGAGAVGIAATPSGGGAGGAGVTSSINASPVQRAGGGGGSSFNACNPGSGGAGGAGGGGSGAHASSSPIQGANGTANTGGGAGAGSTGSPGSGGCGGTGGSGVVIIRYRFQA
jgi:hypothetical protein